MVTPRQRLQELDMLRAAAIFLVVLFHLPTDLNWQTASVPWVQTVLGYAIIFGMALFFFLSGYAIDLNNRGIASGADTRRFFSKRLRRILPLYWVALGTSFLGLFVVLQVLHSSMSQVVSAGLVDTTTYDLSARGILICVAGAQVLLAPRFINVPNRWFVGTILICYALYPVIAYVGRNGLKRVLLVSAGLFVGLLAARVAFNVVGDDRLFFYFGLFVAGIVAQRTEFFYSGALKKHVAASCALLLPVLLVTQQVLQFPHGGIVFTVGQGATVSQGLNQAIAIAFRYVVTLLFIILAFYVARAHAPSLSQRGARVVLYAATGSYAVFLFHQQFVVGLRLVLTRVLHLGVAEIALIVICVGLPVLFMLAYYEQRTEPAAIDRILRSVAASSVWRRIRASERT